MAEEKEFLEFAADTLGVPVEGLALDTAFGSIPEWDSVMHIRLTLEVEARYDVEIPVDEIADIRTLGGFYKYIQG